MFLRAGGSLAFAGLRERLDLSRKNTEVFSRPQTLNYSRATGPPTDIS